MSKNVVSSHVKMDENGRIVEFPHVRGYVSKHKKSKFLQGILVAYDGKGRQTARYSQSTKETEFEKALNVLYLRAAALEQSLQEKEERESARVALQTPDSLAKFNNFLLWWRDVYSLRKTDKESTIKYYRNYINAHILPFFQPLNLQTSEISPEIIREFKREKLSIGSGIHVETLSNQTVRNALSVVSSILSDAVEEGYLGFNPCAVVSRPIAPRYQTNIYSLKQLMALWKKVRGTVLESSVILASIYGFRRGETCGIRWPLVDFDNYIIHVYETRTSGLDKRDFITDTKNRQRRSMPMMGFIYNYLVDLKAKQERQKKKLGAFWQNKNEYVVVDEFGKPLGLNRISCGFPEFLVANGLPRIRYHALRHSVATYLLELGIRIDEVSIWLGHSSTAVTERFYAHVNIEMRRRTAAALEEIFGGPKLQRAVKKPENIQDALSFLFDEAV